MNPAKGNDPLVAWLEAHGVWLDVLEVVSVGGRALADEAGQGPDPSEVFGGANAPGRDQGGPGQPHEARRSGCGSKRELTGFHRDSLFR